eukprot:Sspe_Gene.114763::Locus_100984_Transcript_3_5_Confidence_0.167_Length_1493::g.114763::m.114763
MPRGSSSSLAVLEAAVTGALAANKDSSDYAKLKKDESAWARRVDAVSSELKAKEEEMAQIAASQAKLQRAEKLRQQTLAGIAKGTASVAALESTSASRAINTTVGKGSTQELTAKHRAVVRRDEGSSSSSRHRHYTFSAHPHHSRSSHRHSHHSHHSH